MSFWEFDNIKKYKDAFFKLPKKVKIPIVIIILVGISVWIWRTQCNIAKKNEEISALRFENEKLQRENLHLKEIVNPLEQKAKELYPELETSTALAKLSEDIETVRALATRDIYRPLNPELRNKVINSLKPIYSKYSTINPFIQISVEMRNKNRELILAELIEILVAAGFQAERKPGHFTISGVSQDITIIFNPEVLDFVQELTSALGPFLNTPFFGKKNNKISKEIVKISIDGTPQFFPNGTVVFK